MPMIWGSEDFEENLRRTREHYARTRRNRQVKSIAIIMATAIAIYLAAQIGEMDQLARGSTTGNPNIEKYETQLSMPGFGWLFGD